ncbi:MAG: glutathione S-transferase [Pseudomonadota bacterium]
MTQPIRIHHFPLSGHAHRAQLFASLAGIPHEIVPVDLAAREQCQPAYLAINPFGQVPAIEDGETLVADSNAILVYLARRYAPDWLPTDPVAEAEVQKFLTLAAGDIAHGPAAARLITVFAMDLNVDQVMMVAKRVLARLEGHLEGRTWLVGDSPTIADVAIYSYTAHAPEGNVSLEPYPNIRAWLTRVEGLPGFVPMPASKAGLVA